MEQKHEEFFKELKALLGKHKASISARKKVTFVFQEASEGRRVSTRYKSWGVSQHHVGLSEPKGLSASTHHTTNPSRLETVRAAGSFKRC